MSAAARWFTDTAREWGWRHTLIGALLGALALFNMGSALFWPSDYAFARNLAYNVLQFGWPFVFALRVADRAVADGAPRGLAYTSATAISVLAGVWLLGPALAPLFNAWHVVSEWSAADDAMLAVGVIFPFAFAALAYAAWRREQDTLARVRAAEVERTRQQQVVQAQRLLALQARVEPQFLFDVLGRIRDALGGDAAASERLLGDLIALLRALQPAAGATASNLRRELALLSAYARTSESAALQPPRLQLSADDDAARARLAPLVLLPALRALAGDAPQAQWRLAAEHAGSRLRLIIAPGRADAAAGVALAALDVAPLAERLRAVHGDDSHVSVVPAAADPAVLRIDVPFEAEVVDDRRPDEEDRQ